MKKAIVTLVAVTAAVVAIRQIKRREPAQPCIPYYGPRS
jgi:hypothetical protein